MNSTIRFSYLRAVLGLALGALLLINPEGSVATLIQVVAIILLIGGLFSFYYATKSKDKGLQRLLGLNGFVCAIFALLLLIFPTFFAGLGMIIVGIILILGAISQLGSLMQFRKIVASPLPWYLYLNPVLVLGLGILILFKPFSSAITLAIFAGCICVLYAILEIIQAIVEHRVKKDQTPTPIA